MKQNIYLINNYKDNPEMLSSIGNKVTSDLEANKMLAEKIIKDCIENDIKILTFIDNRIFPKTFRNKRSASCIIKRKHGFIVKINSHNWHRDIQQT
jgi:hypothetical protein